MTIVLNGSVGIPASSLSGVIPDANAPSGSVIQVVSSNLTSTVSTSSSSFVTTGLSASITPLSSSSKILVIVNGGSMYNNGSEIGRAHV